MYYTSPTVHCCFLYMYASRSWETHLEGFASLLGIFAGYLRFMSMIARSMHTNSTSKQAALQTTISIALPRNRNIIPPLPHPLHPRFDPRPPQQPHCRCNKNVHNRLVLGRVSLEARGEHILLLLALAETVAQTELAVTVAACLLRNALAEIGSGGLLGGGGVEGDDGRVAETGAFAEGCWCWGGVSHGLLRERV